MQQYNYDKALLNLDFLFEDASQEMEKIAAIM